MALAENTLGIQRGALFDPLTVNQSQQQQHLFIPNLFIPPPSLSKEVQQPTHTIPSFNMTFHSPITGTQGKGLS